MNAPQNNISSADEQAFVAALVAYDERLRRGEARPPKTATVVARPADNSTDEGVRACLDVLEFVFPRRSAAPLPERIARFEIERLLGQGGFGLVYLAHDPSLGRRVALKVPRPHVLERPELRERFLREARAAGRLDHPHIVPVYEVGVEGGKCFISSAYCDGGTLDEWLKGRTAPLSAELAARLVLQLAEAVQHAHGRDVLHRDLKPANILLATPSAAAAPPPLCKGGAGGVALQEHKRPTSNVQRRTDASIPARTGSTNRGADGAVPTLKIADFGLAKLLDGDDTHTQSGALFGTPAYMSPEQAAAGSIGVDGRSDVYSLGVILYELLAGRRPFEGEPQAIMQRLLTETPPAPRKIRREIPRDLETVCLQAMARDRDQRYATAGDLADDLRRWLAREPIAARRPRVPLGKQLLTRRNFAGLALSSLPAIGYALWIGERRVEGNERRVTLTTDPPGANIWFIPLNNVTGEPEPERIVEAGKSPVEVPLAPGDYLVEAVLNEERFHEVYRHVPKENENTPDVFNHQFFKQGADGLITLPRFAIPLAAIVAGMALVRGEPKFAMGRIVSPNESLHFCRVPPFYMDPMEVTFGDYRRLGYDTTASTTEGEKRTDQDAMPLKFDFAMSYAEKCGKRLPDEAEYEFAATSRDTYSDEQLEDATSSRGSAGTRFSDRVDLDAKIPIFGLRSGIAEWMINGPLAYPGSLITSPTQLDSPKNYRIVRGAILFGTEEQIENADRRADACARHILQRYAVREDVGARLVRSLNPRLVPADFTQIIARVNGRPKQIAIE